METEEKLSETTIDNFLCAIDSCIESTTQTLVYCLDKGGDHSKTKQIKSLIDCSEICRVAENFFLRDSDYAADIIDICAGVCEQCALACEEHKGDQIMKNCAAICRDCADSCSQIVESEEDEETLE